MSVQGFGSVYGQAQGSLEESVPCALLPFIFLLHSSDGKILRLHISDFHSNTWQAVRTPELLEDLRDQVGIGGSMDDFLRYIQDSFSSENVQMILGGPASSIGGQGATSARVVAQKSKGMPRITLSLEKLTGLAAKDAMGLITVDLLKAYKNQSNALETEGITQYSSRGAVFLLGDFNARTQGHQCDTYDFNDPVRLPAFTIEEACTTRHSEDGGPDNTGYGRHLLDLGSRHHLIIYNGMGQWPTSGGYTCFPSAGGSSTVDYVLGSRDAQKNISELKESLTKAKEEASMLQEQVDATGYRGKRRGRVGASQFTADAIDASLSQFNAKTGSSSGAKAEDSKSKSTGRAVPLRNKVHLAHAKRAKQRGARLADEDDE